MDSKVVVITGANTGIGKETALAVAAQGATTLLACRNALRADEAVAELRKRAGNDGVAAVHLDLADLDSVKRCASDVLDRYGKVDVLINNAGGISTARKVSAQGFEQTFAVNYLGHFLLTRLLLDSLKQCAPSRIVNVTSIGHRLGGRIHWDDLQFERRYRGVSAYNQSKLALILFTRELARRVRDDGVVVHACAPGIVRTSFGEVGDTHGADRVAVAVTMLFSVSPAHGAKTSIHLATSPAAAESSGGYWARSKPGHPSRRAKDDAAARKLWDVTDALVRGAGIELPD